VIPGDVRTRGDVEPNEDLDATTVEVSNAADRPMQIGDRFHLAESNAALQFDREATRGRRLGIPAGTSARIEPG
jgi:urease subunit beta